MFCNCIIDNDNLTLNSPKEDLHSTPEEHVHPLPAINVGLPPLATPNDLTSGVSSLTIAQEEQKQDKVRVDNGENAEHTEEEFEYLEGEEEEDFFRELKWKRNPPAPAVSIQPVKYYVKIQQFSLRDMVVYFFLQYSGLGPEEIFFFPINNGQRWNVGIVSKDVANTEPFIGLPSEQV